jgi:hypothetical protein
MSSLESGTIAVRGFFFDRGVEGYTHAAPITVEGIGFQAKGTQVVERFGKPDSEGGPVKVAGMLKYWAHYNSGLQFDFDNDAVIIVVVSDPKLSKSRRSNSRT